jgi:hypothetical protein
VSPWGLRQKTNRAGNRPAGSETIIGRVKLQTGPRAAEQIQVVRRAAPMYRLILGNDAGRERYFELCKVRGTHTRRQPGLPGLWPEVEVGATARSAAGARVPGTARGSRGAFRAGPGAAAWLSRAAGISPGGTAPGCTAPCPAACWIRTAGPSRRLPSAGASRRFPATGTVPRAAAHGGVSTGRLRAATGTGP